MSESLHHTKLNAIARDGWISPSNHICKNIMLLIFLYRVMKQRLQPIFIDLPFLVVILEVGEWFYGAHSEASLREWWHVHHQGAVLPVVSYGAIPGRQYWIVRETMTTEKSLSLVICKRQQSIVTANNSWILWKLMEQWIHIHAQVMVSYPWFYI